jgi:hypothetical protein
LEKRAEEFLPESEGLSGLGARGQMAHIMYVYMNKLILIFFKNK